LEYLYEAIVGAFLTRNKRFVCPQYSIKADSGKGDWRSLGALARNGSLRIDDAKLLADIE